MRPRAALGIAAATVALGGGILFASGSGGGIDVFIGSTPTPPAGGGATVTVPPIGNFGDLPDPSISGGGGGGDVANLWVDSNGGTCTRQSTAGAYVDAQACATFQATYNAASCGDTVRIQPKSGGYPNADTGINSGSQKNCTNAPSSYITFTPAVGQNVLLGGSGVTGFISLCDVDWVKFLGVRTGATSTFEIHDNGTAGITDSAGFAMGYGGGTPCYFGTSERVDHIWIEGLSFETYLIRGADQITFKDNDIAPGKTVHIGESIFVSPGYDGSNYQNNYPTDLTLDGNDVHNFDSQSCTDSCHVECLTGTFENLRIVNNRFWDCGNSGGIFLGEDGGFSSIGTSNLIENNLIANDENHALVVCQSEAGSVYTIRSNTIRDQSIASQCPDASWEGTATITGNIFYSNNLTCSHGTFTYNVTINVGGSGCTTGTGNTTASTSWTGVVPEFHLAAGQTAQDLIPPGSCPTSVDLDGEARPKGTNCDAGADER